MEMKKWEFRKLCADDMFLMFSILGKIGLDKFRKCLESEDIKKLIKTAMTGKVEEGLDTEAASLQIVLELAQILIVNLENAKNDIYQLLSNTSNLQVKEIKNLSMVDFTDMLIDFIRKDEFPDFFKAVSRLFSKKK